MTGRYRWRCCGGLRLALRPAQRGWQHSGAYTEDRTVPRAMKLALTDMDAYMADGVVRHGGLLAELAAHRLTGPASAGPARDPLGAAHAGLCSGSRHGTPGAFAGVVGAPASRLGEFGLVDQAA
jgi:hypothetical protein